MRFVKTENPGRWSGFLLFLAPIEIRGYGLGGFLLQFTHGLREARFQVGSFVLVDNAL